MATLVHLFRSFRCGFETKYKSSELSYSGQIWLKACHMSVYEHQYLEQNDHEQLTDEMACETQAWNLLAYLLRDEQNMKKYQRTHKFSKQDINLVCEECYSPSWKRQHHLLLYTRVTLSRETFVFDSRKCLCRQDICTHILNVMPALPSKKPCKVKLFLPKFSGVV